MTSNQIQASDNFESFSPNGLELVVNTSTGMAFASISAAARMLGIARQRLSDVVNNPRRNISVVYTQIPTSTGTRSAGLIDAVTLYDMATEYNLDLARQMGRVGANLYLLNQAGYKVKIEEAIPATKLPSVAELLQLGADAARREELVDRYYENKWESYFIEQARSGIKALPSGELIPVKEILNRLGVVLNRQNNHKFFTRLIVCCDAHNVPYLKAGVPRRNKQGNLKALSSNHYDSSVVSWADLLLTDLQAA